MEADVISANPLSGGRTVAAGWLMLMAFAAGLIVITRGTYDLSHLYSLLPLPAWLFFLWTVGLIAVNVFSAFRISQSQAEISPGIQAALVLAIPAAFLAAGLDCMGIGLKGCTPVCRFLIRTWSPLVAVVALAFLFSARRWLLLVITVMSFVYLIPNCRCYNPMNAWWLAHFHRSPACFGVGFWVTLIALAALLWKRFVLASAVTCWMINVVLFAFFIGHHYYRVPW